MKIMLNGQQKEVIESVKLNEILGQFCKDSNHIIAELNGSIIKKEKWQNQTLKENDTLELVSFVGGG